MLVQLSRPQQTSSRLLANPHPMDSCNAQRDLQTQLNPRGAVKRMAKEWIEELAESIRQNAHEAAEAYGRDQHKSAVITTQGKPFFTAFVINLESNINNIKRQLQGDVTASETTFTSVSPTEVKITRSRFPWFDAVIRYQDPIIVLDYAKGLGITGDPTLDRQTEHLHFHVEDDDALTLRQSFEVSPREFDSPEELSRYVTELLFQLQPSPTPTA
jgi:hypothetical protein